MNPTLIVSLIIYSEFNQVNAKNIGYSKTQNKGELMQSSVQKFRLINYIC